MVYGRKEKASDEIKRLHAQVYPRDMLEVPQILQSIGGGGVMPGEYSRELASCPLVSLGCPTTP